MLTSTSEEKMHLFLSIFNGGGRPRNLYRSSALGSFTSIFENNSLKALFGQNMKKLKISETVAGLSIFTEIGPLKEN